MVELDVVDDGDIGKVLQELCGLVEERAVVFVALDHKRTTRPDPIARAVLAEVARHPANEHARIEVAAGVHPAGQRGRRRLAVRAGDHNRLRTPEELLPNELGKRAVPNFSIQHFLELGVSARDGVAHDHRSEVGGDVIGTITGKYGNAFRRQKVAHRRVDILIRAANLDAFALDHRGDGGHRRAADPDEMQTLTQRPLPR